MCFFFSPQKTGMPRRPAPPAAPPPRAPPTARTPARACAPRPPPLPFYPSSEGEASCRITPLAGEALCRTSKHRHQQHNDQWSPGSSVCTKSTGRTLPHRPHHRGTNQHHPQQSLTRQPVPSLPTIATTRTTIATTRPKAQLTYRANDSKGVTSAPCTPPQTHDATTTAATYAPRARDEKHQV